MGYPPPSNRAQTLHLVDWSFNVTHHTLSKNLCFVRKVAVPNLLHQSMIDVGHVKHSAIKLKKFKDAGLQIK